MIHTEEGVAKVASGTPRSGPGLCEIWALPFRFAPATFGSARIV